MCHCLPSPRLARVSGVRLPALGKAASRSEPAASSFAGWCSEQAQGVASHAFPRGPAGPFLGCKVSMCWCPEETGRPDLDNKVSSPPRAPAYSSGLNLGCPRGDAGQAGVVGGEGGTHRVHGAYKGWIHKEREVAPRSASAPAHSD